MHTPHYEGTVVQVGNSRGMRLPAGFFKSHPEFNGKVRATFVADGQVLISAQPAANSKAIRSETDPIMDSFLSFLEVQMAANPKQIIPADAAQLGRIRTLVAGVKTS